MVARIGRPGYGSDIRSPQLIRLTRVSTLRALRDRDGAGLRCAQRATVAPPVKMSIMRPIATGDPYFNRESQIILKKHDVFWSHRQTRVRGILQALCVKKSSLLTSLTEIVCSIERRRMGT